MAATKTPRKKTETAEAPKASKAAPKKPAAKAAPVKAAAGKPAPRKAPSKKPAAKAVEAEAKPARKGKASATPEPMPLPEPAAPPKPAARKAAGTEPAVPPFAETILAALREGRALEFIFADSEANAPRTFEPRQLIFDALSQAWFVWGWDRRYNAERFHRLDLLAEVNPVEGVGRAAQGPYAEGTPANQIGGWLGGEPIPVKALLMKQWVFAVKQAPPAFPHFQMEEQGDGQALVTFTATDLRAIARWVLQFGDGIQVQEPARLQDRIKQVAAVWMGRDRQSTPAPRAEAPRHEARHEAKAEPRAEHRPARPEPAPEPRRHEGRPAREPRREQEEDAPKGKAGKLEIIRFDRL